MVERKQETPEPTVFGVEEAMARIALEQMKPEGEKLKTVTDVTPEEIFALSALLRYADLFDSTIMKKWVEDFMRLRISRWRLGRKENLLTVTGIREVTEERKRRGAKATDLFAGLR